jgi:hypothetical protein
MEDTDTTITITAPIRAINSRRKIYAEVNAADFELFRDRARAEGTEIGEALSELVHQYAHGACLVAKTTVKKNHKGENTGVDYRKAREGK